MRECPGVVECAVRLPCIVAINTCEILELRAAGDQDRGGVDRIFGCAGGDLQHAVWSAPRMAPAVARLSPAGRTIAAIAEPEIARRGGARCARGHHPSRAARGGPPPCRCRAGGRHGRGERSGTAPRGRARPAKRYRRKRSSCRALPPPTRATRKSHTSRRPERKLRSPARVGAAFVAYRRSLSDPWKRRGRERRAGRTRLATKGDPPALPGRQ